MASAEGRPLRCYVRASNFVAGKVGVMALKDVSKLVIVKVTEVNTPNGDVELYTREGGWKYPDDAPEMETVRRLRKIARKVGLR